MGVEVEVREMPKADVREEQPERQPPASVTEMLRDIGAGFRESLAAAQSTFQEQRHEHYTTIADFIRNSDQTLRSAEGFAQNTLGEIRRVDSFNSSFRALQQSLRALDREAARINEDIVSLMPHDGQMPSNRIKDVLNGLSMRAQDAALSLNRNQSAYRDDVYGREIEDARQRKLDEVRDAAVNSLNPYLNADHFKLSFEAQQAIREDFARRVEVLLAPVRNDSVDGIVNPDTLAAQKEAIQEVAKRPFRPKGTQESVVVPELIVREVGRAFDRLQRNVDTVRKPQEESIYIRNAGLDVRTSIDELGRGSVSFTQFHTRSSVTFTLNDSGQSIYDRVQSIRRVIEDLRHHETGGNWDAASAQSFARQLGGLSSKTDADVAQLRPSEDSPYRKQDTGVRTPQQTAAEIMSGRASLTLERAGKHSITVAVNGDELEVRNRVPGQDGVELRVIAPMSAVRHREGGLQRVIDTLATAIKSDEQSAKTLSGAPESVSRAILAIPEAKVAYAYGLEAKATDVTLAIAPTTEISNIKVGSEGVLRISGKGANRSSAVIANIDCEKKGAVRFDVEQVTIQGGDFRGVFAGSIKDSRLEHVTATGRVRQFLEEAYGTVGEPITDGKCVLIGCKWAKDIVPTWDSMKREHHLVRA